VHVAGLATDDRLIDFNGPLELLKTAGLHGEADAVEHEPGRLLSDAESASEFVRRDAVLRVGDEPNRREPLVETEGRILEDGADLHGELLFARLALPEASGGQVGVRPLTAGANRAVRPAETGDELGADIQVTEVPDSFEERGRERLHRHVGESTTLWRVSQVCQSPYLGC
jgi:hypothetical protein